MKSEKPTVATAQRADRARDSRRRISVPPGLVISQNWRALVRAWLTSDFGRNADMKYLLSWWLAAIFCVNAFGSPYFPPSTRHQFNEFQKSMVPMYGAILKEIDTRLPAPRDPQLKLRRRDIDGLIDAIREEAVPKISRRIERDLDLGTLAKEFEWLSDMVEECEIQIDRYVMRAVAVGELRLDVGLHFELESFAAHSGSFRHALGSGYREEYRNGKAKERRWELWHAIEFRSPLTIGLFALLASLIAISMAHRFRQTKK